MTMRQMWHTGWNYVLNKIPKTLRNESYLYTSSDGWECGNRVMWINICRNGTTVIQHPQPPRMWIKWSETAMRRRFYAAPFHFQLISIKGKWNDGICLINEIISSIQHSNVNPSFVSVSSFRPFYFRSLYTYVRANSLVFAFIYHKHVHTYIYTQPKTHTLYSVLNWSWWWTRCVCPSVWNKFFFFAFFSSRSSSFGAQ